MSDNNKIPLPKVHGFEIDDRGHEHAMHAIRHMDKEQLHEMTKNIKNNYDHDHNSHFDAVVGEHHVKYKLEKMHHGDGFEIHEVKHY